MICKHPDIQEKTAKEVMEATQLNHNSSIEELASNITEKTLEKMQYLHAALTETLRLYPAIPKGQSVTYLPYAMGRMKYLWGYDAEEFRPERDGSMKVAVSSEKALSSSQPSRLVRESVSERNLLTGRRRSSV
ncbi:hypothetical protein Dsin_014858 [Dipteronia sinensis]|uniref:Cytochrome P450 n=1 Tax=Dipteronia sinensis TaxID=43782 RepID=A0AAE0AMR6_9ROSI|nr:hypothetical protein Dsin_014858 [Dipteronia sinensis]